MKKAKIITLINANVYDGTLNMKLKENTMIEVTGNKITNIGTFEISKDAEVIDLKGKYVVPGLINLHEHLPSSGKLRKKKLGDTIKLVNFILSNKLNRKIGLLLCKGSLVSNVNSGVTTVRTVGGLADFDSILRDQIVNGKFIGPRVITCNSAIGVEGGHMVGTVTNAIHNNEEIKANIDRLKKENADLIKIMITGGVLDGKEPGHPGQLAMSEEMVQFACDYAHENGLKVVAHVEGKEGMNIAMKCGVDSIEHSSPFEETYVKAFKERNGAVVITLSPAVPFVFIDPKDVGYGEIGQINSKIVFDGMVDSYKLCKKYGITVGLGTDAGSTLSTQYNFYRELILFKNYCNESANFALHTATLVNAKIAGVDDITGSIEINKCADLLVIENDPLENLNELGSPVMVFANGNLIRKPKIKYLKKEEELLKQVNWENK